MTEETHRVLREQLGAYALDQLDRHERLALDAHLSGCAACRAELREIEPVAAGLRLVDASRLSGPHPSTPPGLGDTISERVRAERRRATASTWPSWVGKAAAAVLVLAVGAGIGWFVRPDSPTTPKLPLEPVAVQVAQTGVRADAQLVPHTWGVEIKLTASGFVQGAAYRVSVHGTDGTSFPAGEFVGTGPAEMRCNLNSAVLRAQADGFEVRDAGGAVVLTSSF